MQPLPLPFGLPVSHKSRYAIWEFWINWFTDSTKRDIMKNTDTRVSKVSRREFGATLVNGAAVLGMGATFGCSHKMKKTRNCCGGETVRDRLWVWSHPAGAHNEGFEIPKPSSMTPAEGADYIGVPNILLIRYHYDRPFPLDRFMNSFRPMQRVVLSIVGAGGASEREAEVDRVLNLSRKHPNICGVIMDDFFHDPDEKGKIATFTPEELAAIRQRLQSPQRKLNLWTVLYSHQMDIPVQRHLEQCDVVTYWTWRASELGDLEKNFERFEQRLPDQRKVLGCYVYNYGEKSPMPVDAMRHQCNLGLQWLRKGRIEGIIILATNVFDIGLDSVEWTRRWIDRVADLQI